VNLRARVYDFAVGDRNGGNKRHGACVDEVFVSIYSSDDRVRDQEIIVEAQR